MPSTVLQTVGLFDTIAPSVYRYRVPAVDTILCEKSFLQWKLTVEVGIVQALVQYNLCPESILTEFQLAVRNVTPERVYELESESGHDIQAMIDALKEQLSPEAALFVHRYATSYDIVETANAIRYKNVVRDVVIPAIKKLMLKLCALVNLHRSTLQTGRSHGQAGLPITFGFAMAMHLDRLGQCFERIKRDAENLTGKFSGAMGSYNALTFFGINPMEFEKRVLACVDVRPGLITSQIVSPEALMWLLKSVCDVAGVVANIARDLRHLQRTEIAEVFEPRKKNQHGSSTMKQKRNPVKCEQVESLWKVLVGRGVTLALDQLSEHQRDLTGSASSRMQPEIISYATYMIQSMEGIIAGLEVNTDRMRANLVAQRHAIIGEPLYLLLSALGHPDAPTVAKNLCQSGDSPLALMRADPELKVYVEQMEPSAVQLLEEPERYIGQSAEKATEVVVFWMDRMSKE